MSVIKAKVVDAELLKALAPAALRAYAQAQGWKRTEAYGEHSDIYVRAGSETEAIIPGTNRLGDYANVVSDLLRIFALAEERDELQVFRDLTTADRDVIRLRAPEADEDGSVKLGAAVDMVVHAKELLLAAACAAWKPRPTYRAGKIREATDYLDSVRMGQTEQGSFVLTILAPVPPALEDGSNVQLSFLPDIAEEPFERRVTRRLIEGLTAARGAIEKYNRGGGFAVFEESVEKGISANLCEAASALIANGDGLDVSLTWARTRRTLEPISRLKFSKADGVVLREAARLFHEKQPRPEERLEGYIVKLNREPANFDGKVTLKAFVDGRPASVQIDFPPPLYAAALDAHGRNLPVSVVGELLRVGRRWRLELPRQLEIGADDAND